MIIGENLGVLKDLFAQLRSMSEERGVRESPTGSVIKSGEPIEKKVNPQLTADEVSRVRASGEVLADIFAKHFKVGKYVETKKTLGDLTPDKLKSTVPSSTLQTSVSSKDEKGGLLGLLASLFPFLGLLKGISLKSIMTGLGTRIGAWLKGLKIGEKLKGLFTKLGSGLWRGIKAAGRGISGAAKWLGEKIRPWLSRQVDKLKNLFKPFTTRISALWNAAKNGISGFAKTISDGMKKVLGVAKNALSKIPGMGKLMEKVLPSAAGAGAAGAATQRAATEAGEAAAQRGFAGRVLNWGKEKIMEQFNKLFKASPGLLGKTLKRIPVIGTIFEGFSFKRDIDKMRREFSEGAISQQELTYKAGKRVVEGVAGIAGATLGGAIGTALGPVGSILGAVGGDILSRWTANMFVDKLMSPAITNKIGSYVIGGNEMQDFIIKGSGIYPFSSKDEILGMKTGGAIDGLLRDLTSVLTKSNEVIANKAIEQVERLEEIVYILRNNAFNNNTQQTTPPMVLGNMPKQMIGYDRTTLNSRTLIA